MQKFANLKQDLLILPHLGYNPIPMESSLNHRFLRLETTRWDVGLNYSLTSDKAKKKTAPKTANQQEFKDIIDYYDNYVDFDIPWSLSVDFAWNYSKSGHKATIDNTVRLTGDISLTPKWKIGVTSSYDIMARKFTATSLSLHRDLHCWEMRFSVVPFGDYKSYSFTINARSAILRDLKWDKRKAWQDNF